MPSDSKLFPPRPAWEATGYEPDEYGGWIGSEGDVLLPLYEGRMIGQFDFSKKGWVSGKGRSAVWRDIPWDCKTIEPQYLMSVVDYVAAKDRYAESKAIRGNKLSFMDVTSATNARTMVASVVPDAPCGHSAPVLASRYPASLLAVLLNSIAYDCAARARCGGLHLSYFVVEESPLPAPERLPAGIGLTAPRLAICSPIFAVDWLRLASSGAWRSRSWRRWWAVSASEGLRMQCMLDAVLAEVYGLGIDDFSWVLRDCDHPTHRVCDKSFARTLD